MSSSSSSTSSSFPSPSPTPTARLGRRRIGTLAGAFLGGIALAMAACSSSAPSTLAAPASAQPRELREVRPRMKAQAGSEIGIATTGSTLAPFFRNSVSIASSGSGYLAVWDDERDVDGAEVILGQLFDANGIATGATPLVLARNGASMSSWAAVAWDGTNYEVAWLRESAPTAGNDSATAHDVVATRVAPNGSVVDPAPVAVLTGQAYQSIGQVRCAPSGGCLFVAVDTAGDGSSDVIAAYAKALAVGAPISISNRPGNQDSPSVAVDASGFVVVFQDLAVGATAHDVYAQRLSAQGALVGDNYPIATTPDDELGPVVENTGTANDLVAWLDQSADQSIGLVTSQIWPPSGTTTTASPVSVALDPKYWVLSTPAITRVGSDLSLVFTVEDLDTYLVTLDDARVTQTGAPSGTPVVIDSGLNAYALAAASTGTGALVAALNLVGGSCVVHGITVPAAGAPTDTILTNAPAEQRDIVVASNQRDALMTYAQYGNRQWATNVARLSASGQVSTLGALDPSGFRYARAKADSAGNYLVVTLVGDGKTPLTVDAYRVTDALGQAPTLGSAIAVRSELAAPGPFSAWGTVDLACGTDECLVVWSELEPSPADAGGTGNAGVTNFDVYAATVSNAGVVGPAVLLSNAPGEDLAFPTAAFDGSKYIVTYERGASLFSRTWTAGSVGPEMTLATAAAGGSVELSSIACRGVDDCLAAWTEWTATSSLVNSAHVGSQGVMGSPLRIDPATGERPSVVFDGVRYLVAWDTNAFASTTESDVYLTEVSADATSLVATNPIATSPSNEYFASAASMAAGTAVVAYTRMVDDPAVLVPRVFARLVSQADDDAGTAVGGDAGTDAAGSMVDGGSEGGLTEAGSGGGSIDGGSDGATDAAPGDAGDAGDAGKTESEPDAAADAEVDASAASCPTNGSSGCGCRVGGESSPGGGPMLAFGVAALALARARRARSLASILGR